jgi:Uma2 family endonuclease
MVKPPPHQKLLPPLENGDRLNRYEFERRYNAMPHLKKAELIEGVVYMAAALRFRSHGQPHGHLITWLGVYESATAGVESGIEPTVRLDLDNEPQPDAVLMIQAQAGGQARLSEDDYIEGAPELVAEIAASSAAIEPGDKKRAYRRNGIKEYIVWQVFEQKLDWFALQEGEYVLLPLGQDGIIRIGASAHGCSARNRQPRTSGIFAAARKAGLAMRQGYSRIDGRSHLYLLAN